MKQEKKTASKNIPPNEIYAILYGRISGESDRGLSEQLRECKSFAKANSWIVEKNSWYNDVYSSNLAPYLESPGLLGVLDHIDEFPERTFAVVTTDLARVARRRENLENYCTELYLRGASLEVVHESGGQNLAKEVQTCIAGVCNGHGEEQCRLELQAFKEELLRSIFCSRV